MFKVCSIFLQMLKFFSRGDFEKAVKGHKAEQHARGFTSWGQFVAIRDDCYRGREDRNGRRTTGVDSWAGIGTEWG